MYDTETIETKIESLLAEKNIIKPDVADYSDHRAYFAAMKEYNAYKEPYYAEILKNGFKRKRIEVVGGKVIDAKLKDKALSKDDVNL